MGNKTAFKNLDDYFNNDNKVFIIPNYQRGYKWAVRKKGESDSAVEKLVKDLLIASVNDNKFFFQGVTVVEDENKIILIDGQQRTTTLYLLLYCLDPESIKSINLDYDIREESKLFIKNLKEESFDPIAEKGNSQDVFYFKEAIKQIQFLIEGIDNKKLLKFLFDKVTLLYIIIDKEKATKTFTMMNGSKATMLQEELIKAEFLRCVSLPKKMQAIISTTIDSHLDVLKEAIAHDWETNALRSRYAREWDKWLYWWNNETVKTYFNSSEILGLLLPYYFKYIANIADEKDQQLSLSNFKILIQDNETILPKSIFKSLRDLQKSFEDLYNNPRIYNSLKMSLICGNGKQERLEICNYFILNKLNLLLLEDYSKLRLIGISHQGIINKEIYSADNWSRAEEVLGYLSSKNVYSDYYDLALKQLLRLNVEEDNKLFECKGRKFDFSIYGAKSLEHIHPKSKVYHLVNDENTGEKYYRNGNNDITSQDKFDNNWINRNDLQECTEHAIGNLLLLDKDENSKFSDKPFHDKKLIYFNVDEIFESRNLLHTISVFSKSSWTKEDIQQNQKEFISRFKKDYKIA